MGYWQRVGRSSRSPRNEEWRPIDAYAYAYVLGLYLGDGHIVESSLRSGWLRLTLDRAYPQLADEVVAAVTRVFPLANVRRYDRPERGAIAVEVSTPFIHAVFPQHGPGAKHNRPIVLADWQRTITQQHADRFIRGLMHSDGCRTINRFSTRLPSGRTAQYEYVRYFFSNLSADIRALFCEHCEMLGIRSTRSNHRNISIAHRHSVARLEEIVGPKA